MDPYLIDLLDDFLEGITAEAYLNQSWTTWSRKRDADSLGSFNDFVLGNLNGSIISLYSSYNGKNIIELMDDEYEELRKMLLDSYNGLEKKIEMFEKTKIKV